MVADANQALGTQQQGPCSQHPPTIKSQPYWANGATWWMMMWARLWAFSLLLMHFLPSWSHFTCFSSVFIISTHSLFLFMVFTSFSFQPLFQAPCSLLSQYLYSLFSSMTSLKSPSLGSIQSFPLSTINPWVSECCWRNVHDLSWALGWVQHSLYEFSQVPVSLSPQPSCPVNYLCLISLRRWPCPPLHRETWSRLPWILISQPLVLHKDKIRYICICPYCLDPDVTFLLLLIVDPMSSSTLCFLFFLDFSPTYPIVIWLICFHHKEPSFPQTRHLLLATPLSLTSHLPLKIKFIFQYFEIFL